MKRYRVVLALLAVFLVAPSFADSWDDDYTAARKLLEAHKIKEAGELYRPLKTKLAEALKKSPDDAHLNFVYGKVCIDGGDDAGATGALDKALKSDPKNVEILRARALLYIYQDKADDAIMLYQRAVEAAPKDAAAWYDLARAQANGNFLTEGMTSARKAMELEPKNGKYIALVGGLLTSSDKTDEALALCKKALDADPKCVEALRLIGHIHQLAEHHKEALDAYKKVVEVAPEDWDSWATLVQLYQALEQMKDRDAAREKVLELWKAGKIHEESFIREQFTYKKQKIAVLEYFELKGERALRYVFALLDEQGRATKRISLGSYEMDTQIARETGSIGKDERMYHLDFYEKNRHATLGMFKKEPGYEDVRKMVIAYLDKELQPAAESIDKPNGDVEIKIKP